MDYDVIIGLEIHAEINTKSKMFCSCLNDAFNPKPNSVVCPICLGHPGTLPLINQEAINKVILLGLALNCQINKISKFDRKNYFYPDLPKGYQISQYDLPLAHHGYLEINKQKIEITRIHLEEDTAKLNHPQGKNHTLIDFNRAGVPLLELVTEPVIKDALTAKIFCQTFQQILKYLKISEANMEKGEMRCEANVSLQKKNSWYRDKFGKIQLASKKSEQVLNNKVELKNINSFKSLERAINYEIKRQQELLNQKKEVLAETRGYNENTGETFRQRIKESGADYRYFPEPDILPLKIEAETIKKMQKKLMELPHKKSERFIREYKISPEITEILVSDKDIADWIEMVISELREWLSVEKKSWENNKIKLIKLSTDWLTNELFKLLKQNKKNIKEIKISAENFAELMSLIYLEKINSNSAQKILKIMFETGQDPSNIMEELNLEQRNETHTENKIELEKIIKKIIKNNSKQFQEYLDGKESLLQFFIGKVMAETKGQFKPQTIIEYIKKVKKI